jgi:hypothetical protein
MATRIRLSAEGSWIDCWRISRCISGRLGKLGKIRFSIRSVYAILVLIFGARRTDFSGVPFRLGQFPELIRTPPSTVQQTLPELTSADSLEQL